MKELSHTETATTETAILVGLLLSNRVYGKDPLVELAGLAETAGVEVVGSLTQRRQRPVGDSQRLVFPLNPHPIPPESCNLSFFYSNCSIYVSMTVWIKSPHLKKNRFDPCPSVFYYPNPDKPEPNRKILQAASAV